MLSGRDIASERPMTIKIELSDVGPEAYLAFSCYAHHSWCVKADSRRAVAFAEAKASNSAHALTTAVERGLT